MGIKTPIAFLVFNRPETTEQVFAAIRQAQPETLLLIADGPRPDRIGEVDACATVRKITDQVDWPCRVFKNYSDTNLGCKLRVSSGLDWVFQTVDKAIILEDDCLPDASFFAFCEEMLDRYKSDERIGHISGVNFQFGCDQIDESYYFSRYPHVWGWASWRRAWQNYDVEMQEWPLINSEGKLGDIFDEKSLQKRWKRIFDRVHEGKIDTWDYQWVFANLINSRLSITPHCNLVSNIGFGAQATHTLTKNRTAEIPAEGMQFPLQHPRRILRDRIADYNIDLLNFTPSKWSRIRSVLIKLLS